MSPTNAMNAMESDLQNETIEKEIDKIQTAIQNLDIKILRETHKLDRYKVRKNKRINKFQTRIALKHTQISALAEKQLLSNPTSPFSTSTLASASASASTSLTANAKDKGKSKAKPKHEVEEEDEYTSLLISPNWDTRDPKKLVTWQLERHINWATPNPPWNSRASLHRILDLRTAAELQDGHPPGQGNTMLERKYCRVDPGEDVWGKPAAALLVHVMRAYKDPNGWMLRELPRMLLVKMEGWFFGLSEREREELPGDANDWEGLPEDVAIAWNQALGVGNFIWE